ncbi:MAG TPA: sulfite exporter TauE/SafE family protein [Telluria sp.]|nr:sulfite exporter TauE/SafE family protein [Telluria sp.]
MTLHLLLGLITGAILALTGAGGGILAVPLLLFGAHLRLAEAAPIGLVAVGMAAALGAGLGLKAGIVRYRAAMLMSGVGMLCSPVGLWLAQRTGNRELTILFAGVLGYVAWRGWRASHGKAAPRTAAPACVRAAATGRFVWTAPCAWRMAASGALAGLLSGLLGVGGGFVVVPALRSFTDLSMDAVVATSLAVIALVSAAGVASSALSGHLNWAVAVPFCAGSLAGMLGGRVVAARLAGVHLQRGFALVAAAVAVGMLVRGLS